MSETTHPPAGASGRPLDYTASVAPTSSGLLRLGGALGIAACCVGLAVMVLACAGMNKAIVLSIIPVALSAPGLVLSIAGAVFQKRAIHEDTHVLHAMFVNIAGLLGGLFEMAVWMNWPLFHR